jgi:RNA polymerase sigma factor (sigma-70 family)
MSTSSHGETLFLSSLPIIEQVTRAVARRHHLAQDDVEELASVVHLRLIESDYRVLRRFQHRSSLRTFLVVVIHRIYLDMRVAEWGKWRPSAAAKRQGSTAVLFERLIYRDGLTFDEAMEVLSTRGIAASRASLELLAAQQPVRASRRTEDTKALSAVPAPGPLPEDVILLHDRSGQAVSVRRALARALQTLEPEDRLIVVLRFQNGLTLAQIARTLQIDAKPLYPRLRRHLDHLRCVLESEGTLVAGAIDELLAHGGTEPGPIGARGTVPAM